MSSLTSPSTRRGTVAFALALAAASAPSVAAERAARADRRHIVLPSRPVQAPFSDGVLVGDTLYLAGRLGLDPKTGAPPPELEAEVRLVLDGIRSVLAEAGMTMDDLVQVQVFSTAIDPATYDTFNRVYRTYFPGEFPARAFVGSGPLLKGARVEVLGIAVRGGAAEGGKGSPGGTETEAK